jgi:hypothetical protein
MKDENGALRLGQPDDVVRSELAAALSCGVPIVPVLVQGARMPTPADLPEELRGLAEYNACTVHDDHFEASASTVVRSVAAVPRRRKRKAHQST